MGPNLSRARIGYDGAGQATEHMYHEEVPGAVARGYIRYLQYCLAKKGIDIDLESQVEIITISESTEFNLQGGWYNLPAAEQQSAIHSIEDKISTLTARTQSLQSDLTSAEEAQNNPQIESLKSELAENLKNIKTQRAMLEKAKQPLTTVNSLPGSEYRILADKESDYMKHSFDKAFDNNLAQKKRWLFIVYLRRMHFVFYCIDLTGKKVYPGDPLGGPYVFGLDHPYDKVPRFLESVFSSKGFRFSEETFAQQQPSGNVVDCGVISANTICDFFYIQLPPALKQALSGGENLPKGPFKDTSLDDYFKELKELSPRKFAQLRLLQIMYTQFSYYDKKSGCFREPKGHNERLFQPGETLINAYISLAVQPSSADATTTLISQYLKYVCGPGCDNPYEMSMWQMVKLIRVLLLQPNELIRELRLACGAKPCANGELVGGFLPTQRQLYELLRNKSPDEKNIEQPISSQKAKCVSVIRRCECRQEKMLELIRKNLLERGKREADVSVEVNSIRQSFDFHSMIEQEPPSDFCSSSLMKKLKLRIENSCRPYAIPLIDEMVTADKEESIKAGLRTLLLKNYGITLSDELSEKSVSEWLQHYKNKLITLKALLQNNINADFQLHIKNSEGPDPLLEVICNFVDEKYRREFFDGVAAIEKEFIGKDDPDEEGQPTNIKLNETLTSGSIWFLFTTIISALRNPNHSFSPGQSHFTSALLKKLVEIFVKKVTFHDLAVLKEIPVSILSSEVAKLFFGMEGGNKPSPEVLGRYCESSYVISCIHHQVEEVFSDQVADVSFIAALRREIDQLMFVKFKSLVEANAQPLEGHSLLDSVLALDSNVSGPRVSVRAIARLRSKPLSSDDKQEDDLGRNMCILRQQRSKRTVPAKAAILENKDEDDFYFYPDDGHRRPAQYASFLGSTIDLASPPTPLQAGFFNNNIERKVAPERVLIDTALTLFASDILLSCAVGVYLSSVTVGICTFGALLAFELAVYLLFQLSKWVYQYRTAQRSEAIVGSGNEEMNILLTNQG